MLRFRLSNGRPNWFRRLLSQLVVVCLAITSQLNASETKSRATNPLRVHPKSIKLTHRRRPHSIVASKINEYGQTVDLTSQATFSSSNETVAKVDVLGWVTPTGNGSAEVSVKFGNQVQKVKVEVKIAREPLPFSFRDDVMPVLSKGGCNAGACHGYSLGKNGFKLSLRGSDPEFDYRALTSEFFGRRVNRSNPPSSLLLTKPLGDVPHKGGVRFDHGTLAHDNLLGWIKDGAANDVKSAAKLEGIRIFPETAVLAPETQQQLQLIADYSDGTTRDVTRLGIFTVNTQRVASVTDEGVVSALELGETAVVGRFERIFATANFIVLDSTPDFKPTPVPKNNLVDRFVVQKLNELKINPSRLATDVAFLRRIYIDLIGIQPTPAEVRAFVASKDPKKRQNVVEDLFGRSEFVDQWSLKWGDLLQNSRNRLSEPAVYAFREWIRGAVSANMPLDEFVRTVLTGKGGVGDDPTTAYFVVSKDTDDTLQRATQLFCGVRMLCAKCHAHPFENWTQGDYYGLHSFFNQVSTKNDPRLRGVANAKSVLINAATGFSRNPRTGQLQPPRFLGGSEPKILNGKDRRQIYAKWLTSPTNPFFAKSMTNRIWSYFFHRGIIEPVDDLRTTNPPINPQLLSALTEDFVKHKFDVRHLMRTIVNSQTYQRSVEANATNGHDDLNFSRAIPRRQSAEALLDSLVQATGVPEKFNRAPAGFTAKQLPDANIQSEFLNLFGKPQRMEACECERDDGSNMLQALHFINGKSILSRVTSADGRVAKLVNEKKDDRQLIEELYLWSLARFPNRKEVQVGLDFFKSYGKERKQAAEDLTWALLNSKDFMLVH